ncbi:unnamed protein product [Vitrella brassicaformis CCMP3155]|uniref:Uncharacterized protein n=1 Tax=Vitrella brassicaformis (strain CCMP3155) TaxID=1169540 RepID=A0A0G4FF45_VITBC|nr:unnamed protein product [Vitrella brassicaformis CCMP3155]|eukprot:CEM11476.1 unnamed protein product [Vitrella brassicaformis CCMP3155]
MLGEEATDGDWAITDPPPTAPQHTTIVAPAAQDTTAEQATTADHQEGEEGGGVSTESAAETEEEGKTAEGAIEAGGPSPAGSPLEDAIGGASDSDEAAANITTDMCVRELIEADIAEKYKCKGVELGPQNHKEHKTLEDAKAAWKDKNWITTTFARSAPNNWHMSERPIKPPLPPRPHVARPAPIREVPATERVGSVAIKACSFKWRQEAIHKGIKEVWGVEFPPYQPTDEVEKMFFGHSFSRKNKALGACGAATNTDSGEEEGKAKEEAKEEQPMLDKDGDPIKIDFNAFARHLTKKYELYQKGSSTVVTSHMVLTGDKEMVGQAAIKWAMTPKAWEGLKKEIIYNWFLTHEACSQPWRQEAILKAIKEQWGVDYPPYEPTDELEKMFHGYSFSRKNTASSASD